MSEKLKENNYKNLMSLAICDLMGSKVYMSKGVIIDY